MARLSASDKWSSEIRELVGRLRAKGATIDAIKAKLAELDVHVPRSTLGREIKGLDDIIADIRQSREVAEAIGSRLDDAPASTIARGNVEILQSFVMKVVRAARNDDGAINFDPKDLKILSETLRNLASASKVDLDREIRLRQEVVRQLEAEKAKAAEAAASQGRQMGMDDEAVGFIRAKILGITLPGAGAHG